MLISEHSSWLILRQGSDAIMFRKNHPCRFHREIRYNAHDHRRQSCGCTTRPKRTRTKSARAWIVQTIEVRQLSAIDYLSGDFAASAHGCAGEQALDSVSLNSDRDLKLGILSHEPIRGEWLCDNKLSFYSNCGR
jgi:hypothetical protein